MWGLTELKFRVSKHAQTEILVRVVVADKEDPAVVVTLYRTTNIERYWSES